MGRAVTFIVAVLSLVAAAPSSRGAEVILQEPGRAERCTTCHERVADHPGTLLTRHPPERFGCVVCHGGDGEASDFKRAHVDTTYTVRPFNLLDDPQTNIRHFLKGVEMQGSCFPCHENVWDEITGAPVLSRGARFFRNNCSGCHEVSGLESWRKPAPPLTRLRWKVSREWAIRFLKNPASVQQGARMPRYALRDEEAEAILDYLFGLEREEIPRVRWDPVLIELKEELAGKDLNQWVGAFRRGEQLWKEARCPVCHASREKAALVPFDVAPSLERVADKVNRDWLYLWLGDPPAYYPHTNMPRFRFADADLEALVHYLLRSEDFTGGSERGTSSPEEPLSSSRAGEGRELVAYYGCAGCHEIEGHERDRKIGPTLSDFGVKPLEQLHFGREEIARTRPAWIARKLTDPRFTAQTTLRSVRMPDMGLSPEQVEALTVFLMSLTGQDVPQSLWPVKTGIGEPLPPTPEDQTEGRDLFRNYCAPCHGEEGKGDGTDRFESFPRDLTAGIARSRSTMSWEPPTPLDLFRTLTRGMPGSAMPPFAFLGEAQRWQLVRYVRSLVKEEKPPGKEIVVPEELPVTPESLARGKELYEGLKCFGCHGRDARGLRREEGKFENWRDEAGRPIPRSADLTRGIFKSGSRAKDLYRILKTGLAGTPMPPYGLFLDQETDWWALVHYVQSFFRKDIEK